MQQRTMVECLQCGERRAAPEPACPRCSYVGWAYAHDLDEPLRRALRDHPPAERGLPAVRSAA
jgi:hypothetical protein